MADKPLFCSQCGYKKGSPNDKFCPSCGCSIEQKTSGDTSTRNTLPGLKQPKSTITLEEFRKRKEACRSSYFEPKSKKNKKPLKRDENVTITVGIMRLFERSTLKKIRGSNMALTISASSNQSTILERAIGKHTRFNKKFNSDLKYTVLYPDGSEVKSTLPGSNEPFSLEKYKEELGKPYSRITFFISKITDFMISELPKVSDSDESSDDQCHEINNKSLDITQSSVCSKGLAPQQTSANSSSTATVSQSSRSCPATSIDLTEIDNKRCELEANKINIPTCTETSLATVECPTCFLLFSVNEIADHADSCADIWVGEVEQYDDFQNVSGNPELEPLPELQSLSEGDKQETCEENIKSVLARLAEGELSGQARVNLRRTYMWNDFKEAREKDRVKPHNRLKVVFLGEPAIDDGGPRREFFSGKPVPSTIALMNGDFRLAGEIMAMSIIQGGPAPCLFAKEVVLYLTKQPLSYEKNNGVYKTICQELMEASDDEHVRDILLADEVMDILQVIGYKGVPHRETKLSVHTIIQSMCIKDQLSLFMPQLMQLEDGLRSCNILPFARRHPQFWEPILSQSGHKNQVTPDEFLDQLVADFSSSQIHKQKEIDVFKYFCDFIMALEVNDGEPNMDSFLKWMTGCSTIPPLGLPTAFKVAFIHGCNNNCQCRPTVSTCSLLLKLPLHINSGDEMVTMMHSAMNDCIGFGLV